MKNLLCIALLVILASILGMSWQGRSAQHLSYSDQLPLFVKLAMDKCQIRQLRTDMSSTQIKEHFGQQQQVIERHFLDQDGCWCQILAYTIAYRVTISFVFIDGQMDKIDVYYEASGTDRVLKSA